jgi:hypothetical protein
MNASHKENNRQRRIRSFWRRLKDARAWVQSLRCAPTPNQSSIDAAQVNADKWQKRLQLRGIPA